MFLYLNYHCCLDFFPVLAPENSKIYTKFYCIHTREGTTRVKYNKYYDAILHLLNYSSKHKFTHSKYTNIANEFTLVSLDISYIWGKTTLQDFLTEILSIKTVLVCKLFNREPK